MSKRYPLGKLILLVILFITAYGLGLLPSYYFNKYVTIALINSGGFYEIIGVMTLVLNFGLLLVSEVLSTTLFVMIFRLRLKKGEYEVGIANKEAFKSLLYHAMIYPLGRLIDLIGIAHLKIFYMRLLGAKIGKNVTFMGLCGDPHLLEVGDNSVIGTGSILTSHTMQRTKLIINKIVIGKNCLIGVNSLILGGARMGDNSVLGALGLLTKNKVVPSNELWAGVPAKKIKKQ